MLRFAQHDKRGRPHKTWSHTRPVISLQAIDKTHGRGHTNGMRVRVSITLSEELREAVDTYAKQRKETRSAFIEAALRALIKRQTWNEHSTRDLEIINEQADFLNREARDVLKYCHG